MADGRAFPVPHPAFLTMSPTGRTVIVYQEDDEFSILDLLLMTEIKMTPGIRQQAWTGSSKLLTLAHGLIDGGQIASRWGVCRTKKLTSWAMKPACLPIS